MGNATSMGLHKDEILERLSEFGNVAQFVSFDPRLCQGKALVQGFRPNHHFADPTDAVSALLHASNDASVNVRSYVPEDPKSREFVYGLKVVDEVVSNLRRLASSGLYTIVNETIDVHDGGVSGVAFGDLLEFAPDDTPRCVEKPGTVSLPREMGLQLLETVYGFKPELNHGLAARVEFSIHPMRHGYRRDHTVVWEHETMESHGASAEIRWPNLFSRMLGDKAFGLLIAHHLGLPVPATTVIPRKLAPFSFGRPTGTQETWIRTCPVEQVPGKYTTKRGWMDPYALLAEEDTEGVAIASVLAQESVDAKYSGALVADNEGVPTVEGVSGWGDDFMLGRSLETLPKSVEKRVISLFEQAKRLLGPVRFEWVFDGDRVWIVQFHRGASASRGRMIYPGVPKNVRRFDITLGLTALRDLIADVQGTDDGITLVGNVGVTSHFGDVLRRAQIPSKVE